ncbi:MAG: tRNA 2-thiocytidine biosynthesis TtcA family protein [Clostridia bacterium]
MQQMLSYMRRCIDDYKMVEDGDRICVGVSGGKDSLTALVVLNALQKFHPKKFEVVAVSLDLGFGGDFSELIKLCEEIDVPLTIVLTDIKEVVFDIRKETNPCSLCAKMRRGSLHETAKKLGCNKVALGHHFDDAVETYMMSLFYEGRISCFQPVTYLDRMDITLIRPMLYMEERHVRSFIKKNPLPVMHNPCPANGKTKRQEIKELLHDLERNHYKDLRKKIFGAMQRYPLEGFGKEI